MTESAMNNMGIDEYFDNGGDMTPFIEEDSVKFPNRDDKARKININMPEWMIDELDATARHFATTRQGVINMWIGERLAAERVSERGYADSNGRAHDGIG
ncbi:MAG TPA: BrnA antitoxin family protein [Coriobacteriaceae bacterium]|nr:BrnA antitoxin family protein [Coriobacteriaceae bacterium]